METIRKVIERLPKEKTVQEFYQEVDAWMLEKLNELNYDNKEEVALYYKTDDNIWFKESNIVRSWIINIYEAVESGVLTIEELPKLIL